MKKYQAFKPVQVKDRRWPDKVLTQTPQWCSVDLRDGNQALIDPMTVEQKLGMFELLINIGFKQIEIGFPSASQIEFDFCRRLIDENRIPDDVIIQILCQAREHLIVRSLEAVKGAKRVIFHLYNSTSPAQRNYTFGMSRAEVLAIAVDGVNLIKKHSVMLTNTELSLEYSPESFTQTEPDFSLEVCEAVKDAWFTYGTSKLILNLPATVEVCMPNQHADQIEWFCRNFSEPDKVTISLHTHNDRGTGIAAAELGLLAGAQRIEGTLFGNGERTGNLDIVTMALNMFSQGIETGLDFSNLTQIAESYRQFTGMDIHPRTPYSGDLVFTAFSGSHQDAIKKALEKRTTVIKQPAVDSDNYEQLQWDVPYLPIDPKDIGRDYEAIIRINSQSGKAGVAWVLKSIFGIDLPKAMRPELGNLVNIHADQLGREVTADDIHAIFSEHYCNRNGSLELISFKGEKIKEHNGKTKLSAEIRIADKRHKIVGKGSGPVEAFVAALASVGIISHEVLEFHEDSLGKGAGSQAIAYVLLRSAATKAEYWGVGIDQSITLSGLKAIVSALNRSKILN